MQSPRGITLIEVVLAIGIVMIMVGLSGFAFSRFARAVSLVSSDRELANAMTRAASHARSGYKGTSWGVYIPYDEVTRRTETMVIFSGTSYAARNVASDVTLSVSPDIAFTSVDFSGSAANETNGHEIVFAALTGETAQYGSVTFEWFGATRALAIGQSGIPVRE